MEKLRIVISTTVVLFLVLLYILPQRYARNQISGSEIPNTATSTKNALTEAVAEALTNTVTKAVPKAVTQASQTRKKTKIHEQFEPILPFPKFTLNRKPSKLPLCPIYHHEPELIFTKKQPPQIFPSDERHASATVRSKILVRLSQWPFLEIFIALPARPSGSFYWALLKISIFWPKISLKNLKNDQISELDQTF